MSATNHEHSSHHTKAYVGVWLTLLTLTVVTVTVSYYDFGEWNIFVAMLVATIKAVLVCLYFMHLKYDNHYNQVVFVAAFVFFAIFIGLTLSDELARPTYAPAIVSPIQEPEGNQSAKMNQLRVTTPELIAKGKTLFQANCVACHGAEGRGDGPAAAALNPHPRNFTSAEGWKNGRSPAQVFKTVTNGIAGSPMAGFSTLSVEDRWAIVHYVESLGPTPPADTTATLAAIGVQEGVSSAKPAEIAVELPLSFTIDRMAQDSKK